MRKRTGALLAMKIMEETMKRFHLHAILVTVAIALAGFILLQQRAPTAPVVEAAAQGDGDEQWYRSDAPVDGVSPQLLSPPDSPSGHSGPETKASQPQAPEGVVLRNFRVPGSALRPRASSVGYYWGGGGGCIYNSGGNPGEIFNVPLELPNGALINTVRMYYIDGSETANAHGWVSVYDLYGDLVQEWAMASTGHSGPGFGDTPVVDHRVDYSTYSYALNWRPNVQNSGDHPMQLCGFRVYYEVPPFNFLPVVGGG